MNAIPPAEALLQQRSELIARWRRRLERNRANQGRVPLRIDDELIGALFDEQMALFRDNNAVHIPLHHEGSAFDRLERFPASVATCIEVLEAGAQVIGAYVTENSGSLARWSVAERNQQLDRIDTIFHILVHREIEALCELCLHHIKDAQIPPVGRFFGISRAARAQRQDNHLRN